VALTAKGRAAFAELDGMQVAAIDALLAPLDETQRSQLVAAMGRIRGLLDGPPRQPVLVIRAPGPGDLGWVVERHGARYAADYGWDASFEALVVRVVADFADRSDSNREAAWIAELDGERVGCVFCTASDTAGTAQLRLLLVEPPARGFGVGTRLVDECLRFAKRSGYARIMLWTNDVLVAARRIYERAGFRRDRREQHRSFGHDLVGEYWSRDL
jgi:GNAT superfamily N-acetyltransferase